jgi:hypothetical protein
MGFCCTIMSEYLLHTVHPHHRHPFHAPHLGNRRPAAPVDIAETEMHKLLRESGAYSCGAAETSKTSSTRLKTNKKYRPARPVASCRTGAAIWMFCTKICDHILLAQTVNHNHTVNILFICIIVLMLY